MRAAGACGAPRCEHRVVCRGELAPLLTTETEIVYDPPARSPTSPSASTASRSASANVSAADRWQKQILAVLAYDDQTADIVDEDWTSLALR